MKKIMQTWFSPKMGIWGKGVYFSSSKTGASIFGPFVLTAEIADEGIVSINYDKWVKRHPDQKTWTKEIKKLKCKALLVHYRHSNEKELCVFDLELIIQIFS